VHDIELTIPKTNDIAIDDVQIKPFARFVYPLPVTISEPYINTRRRETTIRGETLSGSASTISKSADIVYS
jgi:hypothetical protein